MNGMLKQFNILNDTIPIRGTFNISEILYAKQFLLGKMHFVYAKMFSKTNHSLIYGIFFSGMGFGAISETFLENMKCHLIKPYKRTLSVLSLSVPLLELSLLKTKNSKI